jgi:RNA polymerase sigma-B factor
MTRARRALASARFSKDDRAKAREAERQLLVRYHRNGDLAAREELIERFLPLARDLALRYTYTDEPFDDLFQVASLGLIKAIDRFEPGRGTKFTSYAAPTILGELKRHFRDKGWALHVPRDLQERALAVGRERESLSKRLGRSPTVREVALALGCSVEAVLEAAEAAASYETASLDAPVTKDEEESAALVDLLGGDDLAFELVDSRDAIANTWKTLPDVERRVVELRFMHDLTQREIGDRIGYSQMHVSRLLRRALTRLESAADAA